IEDVARLVRIRGLFLSGAAGLETLEADGRRIVHVPRGRGLPADFREALRAWCARFPGAWLEDKGLSVAVHFRRLASARVRAFVAGVRRRARAALGPILVTAALDVLVVLPAACRVTSTALSPWRPLRRP